MAKPDAIFYGSRRTKQAKALGAFDAVSNNFIGVAVPLTPATTSSMAPTIRSASDPEPPAFSTG